VYKTQTKMNVQELLARGRKALDFRSLESNWIQFWWIEMAREATNTKGNL